MNYKVFISGNKLHKEIVMDESCNGITIGTAKDSDVRLRAELFSTPFTVQIIKTEIPLRRYVRRDRTSHLTILKSISLAH